MSNETPPDNPNASKRGKVVQLTSNQADHQVGETFTAAGAKKLGIEKHCVPFTPGS